MAEQLNPTPDFDEGGTPQDLAGEAPEQQSYSEEDLADYRAVDADDGAPEVDDEEPESEEGIYVEGPAEYVQSERGGRPRRLGTEINADDIDYKKVAMLSQFLDRRGRILARRKTRVTAKVQRRVSVAIKRARHLALLPYTADQTRTVRKRR